MLATLTDGAVENTPWYWWVIGFGGQLVFASRFWVQWIASERAKRSVVPISFWYLSLVGGLLSLMYAVYRLDPVFIMGQLTGAGIYVRNLRLIRKTGQGTTSG
jgi:lipid-A-disaccharide synthase-like uncharacterized protein